MKLFIWEPQGHSNFTVTVVAENLKIAQLLADAHVKKEKAKGSLAYEGWNTSYYQLEIHHPGVVVVHAND